MFEQKIIIFGAGQITNQIIWELSSKGSNVTLITNNFFNQVQKGLDKIINIYSYKDIVKMKLNYDLAIYSFKSQSKLNAENEGFLDWLGSESFNVKKSFFLSSASVYPDSINPQNEKTDGLNLSEKYKLETFLDELSSKKGIIHTNLRISNIFGPGLNYGIISSISKFLLARQPFTLYDDRKIVRDYIYVRDVIYAITSLAYLDFDEKTINISSGYGTTFWQILEIFELLLYRFPDIPLTPKPDDFKSSVVLDCTKLKSMISWQPIVINLNIVKQIMEFNKKIQLGNN